MAGMGGKLPLLAEHVENQRSHAGDAKPHNCGPVENRIIGFIDRATPDANVARPNAERRQGKPGDTNQD